MKLQSLLLILTIFFLHQVHSASNCPSGYYDPGPSYKKCQKCEVYYNTCQLVTTGGLTLMNGTLSAGVVAHIDATYGIYVQQCPMVYQTSTDRCAAECDTGCKSCVVTTSLCTNCENGYIWKDDYTCTPAKTIPLGLGGASIAVLGAGLIFSILGCVFVTRARK